MLNNFIYRPVEEAKSAKRLNNFIILFILQFVFMLIGVIVGSLTKLLPVPVVVRQSLMPLISFSITLLLTRLWIVKREGRKFNSIGLFRTGALRCYFKGMFIGILMYSSVMAILYATGNASLVANPTIKTGFSAVPAVLILVPGWIIQTGTEEVLSRGWLLSSLGAKYNILTASLLSSAIFALMHVFNPGITVIAISNIFLVGIAFVMMSLYHGNIWLACGVHFTWNLFQGNVFGCPVSGNVIGNASILSTQLTGNELITGGNFGPEAGIVATTIIIVTILVYGVLLNKKIKARG